MRRVQCPHCQQRQDCTGNRLCVCFGCGRSFKPGGTRLVTPRARTQLTPEVPQYARASGILVRRPKSR